MDTELYDLLEVSRSASDSEIRKAYHRLAKRYHPDKNPTEEEGEKFKEIQFAYEILSDPEKRGVYDRFGIDAVRDGGSGMGGMGGFSSMFGGGDIFSHIFDGGLFGGGGMRSRRKQKPDPLVFPLEVSLEELYTGTTKQLEYKRKILCSQCSGTGSKSGTSVSCRKCRGSGIQVIHKPIGPGMVQQMRSPCSDCGATGLFVKEKDRCKKCKGKQVFEEECKKDVSVNPGMLHNQKITLYGAGDQLPDMESGDVIAVIQEMDHDVFTRKGIDLFVEKTISLVESLCGCSFVIEHLDGRRLAINNPQGMVLFPECIRGLPEEGMPHHKRPMIKGNLYITFKIELPPDNFADEKAYDELESILPSKLNPMDIDEDTMEIVQLHNFDETRGLGGEGMGREVYNDDDDMGGREHPAMGCAHQ